jgi:hypothetical protein
VIKSLRFDNDFLVASINNNVLYLYNGGLGYFISASNGESVNRIFTMDNYRDVSLSKNGTIMQTTAVIAGLLL